MGLLQRAVETYDSSISILGKYDDKYLNPLVPVGHTLTNANIEITIDIAGNFCSARLVGKDEPKIIIPVTEDSGGRTSAPMPHPLCEQLKYLAPTDGKKMEMYCDQLEDWANSLYGHPILSAVLAYVRKERILSDLVKSGLIVSEAKGKYNEKLMVCWRVIGLEKNEETACWKNQNLFRRFSDYYHEKIQSRENVFCMVSGEFTAGAVQHPKGIITVHGNAKLISANDSSGFTYRGRFAEDWQAAQIGYTASQKAHNALRWLAGEQGIRETVGGRVFLCWSPEGEILPPPMQGLRKKEQNPIWRPSDYRDAIYEEFYGFSKNKTEHKYGTAVLASFDAATTGRLSLTYYNELSVPAFLEKMKKWDDCCCWYFGKWGIQSPSLSQIVDCAFGNLQGKVLETDDRIKPQQIQRLLDCKLNGSIIPIDMVRRLAIRASEPSYYEKNMGIWRTIVHTACAALQKYRTDIQIGGDEMSWELDKDDRSFQYGRLLAVMERAELDYYGKSEEERQTNAIKSMHDYRRHPWSVFERINRQLQQAYLPRIDAWQRKRYEKLTGEIAEHLGKYPESELNKPLEDIYLMGYELQRNAFFMKNTANKNETEEK